MLLKPITIQHLEGSEPSDHRPNEHRPYDGISESSMRTTPTPKSIIQDTARTKAENRKNKMTKVVAQVENNIKQRFIENFDILLRAIYYTPPKIDYKNIDTALEQAESLLQLAATFGCLPVVQAHVAVSILGFQRELYETIARDPPRWLRLSLQLHSPPIFKEAVLHIVGNYPKWRDATCEAISTFSNVIEYIDCKINLFIAVKNKIDQELLSDNHWCVDNEQLTLFNAEEPTYNTYLINMAWKDWFGLSLKKADKERAQNHEDATMYRVIANGGEFFMNPDFICHRLQNIRSQQFSEDEVEEIYKDLAKLKEYAQEMVRPLCINKRELIAADEGITHFLCVEVSDEELPWVDRS